MSTDLYIYIQVLFSRVANVSVCHLRVAIQQKPSQAPDDFGGAVYTALDCNESAMEKSRSLLLGKHFFLTGRGKGTLYYKKVVLYDEIFGGIVGPGFCRKMLF